MSTVYHLGGYDPTAPNGNKAEEWDDTARTYTAWDDAGNVVESRPYTAAEIADATAAPPPDLLTVQVDPDALSAIIAAGQKATTVAALRTAFVALGQQMQP